MSNAFKFIEVTMNDGEKGFLLKNSDLNLVNRKEALEYIEKLTAAYNNPSFDQFIESRNNQTNAELNLEFTIRATLLDWFYDDENNQYIINHPTFKMKEFRKNIKQNWSFRCATCNKKVSSSTDAGYFLVRAYTSQDSITEKSCSSACCSVIWRDQVRDWINEKGYQDHVKIKTDPMKVEE
ncbi:hypothetical protein [Niallia taxi]|uniref:hypothetical protein n=1 Tax=Niallia taxi TaxID=2499688 RepID=UPI002E1DACA4|nr:hypothetical protein [Niallia taxi]